MNHCKSRASLCFTTVCKVHVKALLDYSVLHFQSRRFWEAARKVLPMYFFKIHFRCFLCDRSFPLRFSSESSRLNVKRRTNKRRGTGNLTKLDVFPLRDQRDSRWISGRLAWNGEAQGQNGGCVDEGVIVSAHQMREMSKRMWEMTSVLIAH